MGTGGKWQLGCSEIDQFGSRGNVVFELFSTETHKGYVAIDDVRMDTSMACPVNGKLMSLYLGIKENASMFVFIFHF